MTLSIGHLSLVAAPAPPASGHGSHGPVPAPRTGAAPASSDVVPHVPPPEVLDEVGAAAERAAALHADNRELHFQKDPASGRIVVEVRDLEGNVIRTIPPSEALDVMSGLREP